jgi:integrase
MLQTVCNTKSAGTLTMKLNNKTHQITQQHDVLGGKAIIFRASVSGDVWQFRCWIKEEQKYLRKTLGTRDRATALKRAEELYLQIYADIKSGKRLFGITLGELVNEYLKWRAEDVRAELITQGRLGTLSSHLSHIRAYKGANTKLSELDAQSIFDYAQFRKIKQSAKDVTIKNEQATINHMMSYAYRKGYAHFEAFEFNTLRIREVSRRDTFTLEEYDNLVRYMRTYTSKAECDNEELRKQRLMIRDLVLIASNTMLRIGELRQLKWSDVQKYEQHKDGAGNIVSLVTLKVRAETAKTRKSRLITTRGGDYLKRLHNRATFKSNDDYVFCGESGSVMLSRKILYSAWAELMEGIGIEHKERNLTWYSLRHFGITCRLRAGASIFDIAKIVGNSAIDIENHYGHFDQDMSIAASLKNFTISREGIDEKSA